MRELHPGLLAHRAARTRDLPALAAALAHGAEVNWADAEDEGKTPLVQAVLGVSGAGAARRTRVHAHTLASSSPLWWRVHGAPGLPWRLAPSRRGWGLSQGPSCCLKRPRLPRAPCSSVNSSCKTGRT